MSQRRERIRLALFATIFFGSIVFVLVSNIATADNPFASTGPFAVTPRYLFVAAIELGFVIAGMSWLFLRVGRDRQYAGAPTDVTFGNVEGHEEPVPFFRDDPIPVEYVPPDNLRPGQLGTLIDQVANSRDVTATIVDLAVRGYLTIAEAPTHDVEGKIDWTLTKKKGAAGLKAYERILFEALFQAGDEMQVSDLRLTFLRHVRDVEHALYDDAVEQGWFSRRPDATRAIWAAIGFGVFLVGLRQAFSAAESHAGLVAVPLAIGGILLIVGAKWMPRRTAKGTGLLLRTLGFRRFIVESEKPRAEAAEQQNLFTEYLPYAIAFGVTTKWAEAFSDLAKVPVEVTWYAGGSAHSHMSFSNALAGFSLMGWGAPRATSRMPSAAWYPDPTSRNEVRYWDGAAWTDYGATAGQQRMGSLLEAPGSATAGAASPLTYAAAVTAPTSPGATITPIAPVTTHRVCPHCHTQTDTSGVSCPRCGESFAVRKKWPWVVVAIALSMFVGFVGCIAVVGPTIHLDTGPLSAQQAAHAISREQFDAVPIGTSRAEVISRLGKQPQNAQAFEYKGVLSDRLAKRCIYYNRTDGFADDAYQFCFTNGVLASKAPV